MAQLRKSNAKRRRRDQKLAQPVRLGNVRRHSRFANPVGVTRRLRHRIAAWKCLVSWLCFACLFPALENCRASGALASFRSFFPSPGGLGYAVLSFSVSISAMV